MYIFSHSSNSYQSHSKIIACDLLKISSPSVERKPQRYETGQRTMTRLEPGKLKPVNWENGGNLGIWRNTYTVFYLIKPIPIKQIHKAYTRHPCVRAMGWVPAGTSWYQLVPAGTSWVPAGTGWYLPVPVGSRGRINSQLPVPFGPFWELIR